MDKFVILSPYGNLWSAKAFTTREDAQQYLEAHFHWIEPKDLEHTIVKASDIPDYYAQLDYFETEE